MYVIGEGKQASMRRTLRTKNSSTSGSEVTPTKRVASLKSKVKPVPDFSRLHKQWENKFQKGKACAKKPCTVAVGASTKDTPKACIEDDDNEIFDNIIPDKPEDVAGFLTPRQSVAPEKRMCMTDCPPRYSRTRLTLDAHQRAHCALEQHTIPFTPRGKENSAAASVFGSCVVGLPQRQSIYRRYVNTGLLANTPHHDSTQTSDLKLRGCKSEMKAQRVPIMLTTPSKSPAHSAQRTSRSERVHSARRRLPGADRLSHKSPGPVSTSRQPPTWGQVLQQPNAKKEKTDELATRLFSDETKEGDSSTESSPEHKLMALEELEAALYKDGDGDDKKPREHVKSTSQSPASRSGSTTPKRQRSLSAEMDLENIKENMGTPTKRSKVVKEKRAVLGELSPNTYLRREGPNQSPKRFPMSPLSLKNLKSPLSPLALSDSGSSRLLRPFEGSSPRQTWSLVVEDKENMAPVSSFNSPKHTGLKQDYADLSLDDLNHSLSESLMEMENLESKANVLRRRKSENTFVEDSIMMQLEDIKRKQEKLTKMQQQLMLQLKLQRSASAKKPKRHRHVTKSPQKLSPLVEQSNFSLSGSTSGSDKTPSPTEVKTKKKVTFSDPETSPPLRSDEIQSCGSDSSVSSSSQLVEESELVKGIPQPPVKSSISVDTTSQALVMSPATMSPKLHTSTMLSPVPIMQGSAQLFSHHVMPARLRHDYFPALHTPIFTPLALHSAADRAKKLINESIDGISPNSSSEVLDASDTDVPTASTRDLSSKWPHEPQPHPVLQALKVGSPRLSRPLLSPGSMSLLTNLTLTPQSHPVPSPCLSSRVTSQVTLVAERYQEAQLDQEVTLYTGRVGKLLASECLQPAPRCCDPVSRVLMDGDDMHFVPVHSPTEAVECISVTSSAFSHFSFRRI